MEPSVSWYGRRAAPPAPLPLRAGPLSMEFLDGDLRYIRLGRQELVRRVYMAVRDVNWNTVPAVSGPLQMDVREDRFRISWEAVCRAPQLEFRWQGSLEGDATGEVRVSMKGSAAQDFRYCRIGWCVLYPIQGIAGQPYRSGVGAEAQEGVLSRSVAPQLIENGFETAMFPPFDQLTIQHASGALVTARFSGDLFEMEDQRNWTDGSFKVYSTPIALGYPHAITEGGEIQQEISFRVEGGPAGEALADAGEEATIRIRSGEVTPFPDIGFGIPQEPPPVTERESGLLRSLAPAYLKTEVHLGQPDWRDRWVRAADYAAAAGCPLEVALFLAAPEQAGMEDFGEVATGTPVARVIVFHEDTHAQMATENRWLELAREVLTRQGLEVSLVGGTNGNFAELNRLELDWQAWDGMAYPLNPQVHASDEFSLAEALEGQSDTLRTLALRCGDKPLHISAVTLKPPFNQAAREAEAEYPDELPSSVDPREVSLFAAGWTTGSLAALARGGAASVTYYETSGWKGLWEAEKGSPMPELFLSEPGMVFPLWHVFRFIALGRPGTMAAELVNSHPLQVTALALRNGGEWRILAANLGAQHRNITLTGLPQGRLSLSCLNHGNRDTWTRGATPPFASHPQAGNQLGIVLQAYEIVLIKIEGGEE